MNHSESLKEIAPALVKAQAEIKVAEFDSQNPHFRSRYASLNSIVAASKEALSKNGLSILQTIKRLGELEVVVTRLLHQSGEWIEDEGIPLLIDKKTMQGLGSAYTYARRYGMQSLLRIVADEDDDGESAEKASKRPTAKPSFTSPPPSTLQPDPGSLLQEQTHRLKGAIQTYGWSDQEIRELMKIQFGGRKFAELSSVERESMIERITKSWQNEDVS